MYTYEKIRYMCFVLFVCQQMLAQKLMSFTSTWLKKCVFSSFQEYEIQAENQFNVKTQCALQAYWLIRKFKVLRRKCRKAL